MFQKSLRRHAIIPPKNCEKACLVWCGGEERLGPSYEMDILLITSLTTIRKELSIGLLSFVRKSQLLPHYISTSVKNIL